MEQIDRRVRRTKKLLADALIAMALDKGYDEITIQEITDTADVGFGSFYNHFESKTAIVQAIMDETVESYGDVLDNIADAVQDPAEILAASVRYVVMRGCEEPAWGWFLIRASLTMEALRVGLGRRMARDIRAGVEAGRFRAGNVTHTSVAIGGSILSMLAARLQGEIGAEAPEAAAAIALKLAGLPARQAEAVASRPLPELPQLGENAAA